MKQFICIFVAILMFSTVAYAGQWKSDELGYWYQNDDGSYKKGWYQDVDNKWYYFDEQSGYMLSNTETPDGYTVSVDGSWIEGSINSIKNNVETKYDNKVDLEASAYDDGPAGINQLGFSLPVEVYYNDEYDNVYTGKIKVSKVEVSKEGVLYLRYSVDENDIYELSVRYRYNFEDGASVDLDDRLILSKSSDGEDGLCPLIGWIKKDQKLVSAEIYIDRGTIDQ